jgi:predicted lipoprotein
MRTWRPFSLVFTAVSFLGLPCCAPTPMTDQRRELLRSWGLELVLPELESVIARARVLRANNDELCAHPSPEALEDARAAWAAARRPWKRLEVFAFGPASERPLQLGPQIDFWPVRTAAIDAALRDGAYLDASLLGTQKGFPGIEYLLFGPDANALTNSPASLGDASVEILEAGAGDLRDAAVAVAGPDAGVAAGSSPRRAARERCQYLQVMSEALVDDVARLHRAWDPQHDDFLSQLTLAGNGSTEFDSLPMAFGLVVNRMAFIVERIRAEKLSVPMGADGAHLQLDKLESRFSGRSVTDMLDNLDGVEAAYFGVGDGRGLDDYLVHRGKSFAPRMQALLGSAREALLAIEEPLPDAFVTDREAVRVALDRLQELQRLIRVDMLGALSLSLQFTDNDGD